MCVELEYIFRRFPDVFWVNQNLSVCVIWASMVWEVLHNWFETLSQCAAIYRHILDYGLLNSEPKSALNGEMIVGCLFLHVRFVNAEVLASL